MIRKKGIPQILENKLTHAHFHPGTRPYFNRPGIEASADASVEVPLHNIKLLIARVIIFVHYFNFSACKLKEWVIIDFA